MLLLLYMQSLYVYLLKRNFRIGPGGQLSGEGHAVIGRLIGNLIPGAGEDVVRINLAVVAAAVAADGGNIKGVLRDVSIDDLAVVLKADARFLNEELAVVRVMPPPTSSATKNTMATRTR